jgi:hypothetical protein
MGGIPVFSCTTIFPMYKFHSYILLPENLEISFPSFQWKKSWILLHIYNVIKCALADKHSNMKLLQISRAPKNT